MRDTLLCARLQEKDTGGDEVYGAAYDSDRSCRGDTSYNTGTEIKRYPRRMSMAAGISFYFSNPLSCQFI